MKAVRVMTLTLTSVSADLPIRQAHALMLELTARHLPVVDGNKLVGILSDRDVLLSATQRGDDFVYPPLRVGDVMTADPITAEMTTPVSEVAQLMLEHKIDAVPIVSSAGELLGLVTSSDLIRVVAALPDGLSVQLPGAAAVD